MYLSSPFLSALANQRTDQRGGDLANRARLLLDIVRAVRAVVSPRFAVAVKLNSADFQRGGFDAEDAKAVIEMLAPLMLTGGIVRRPVAEETVLQGHSLRRYRTWLRARSA